MEKYNPLSALVSLFKDSLPLGPLNPLFPDVVDIWFSEHRLKIEESTAYNYQKAIPEVKQRFQGIAVRDITAEMIYDYLQYLKSQSLRPTYPKIYCSIVKMSLQCAVKYGYINYNPADDVQFIGRTRTEIFPYDVYEISKLLSVDGPDWVRDAIFIAFHTGMRPGEIFALKWSDIDFQFGFISVQRSISRASSKTKLTKTPAGMRRIDIDSRLREYLGDMREKACPDKSFVFPSPPLGHHEYRVPWNLAPELRKMCALAEIEYRRFYTFRHTHATVLLSMGIHPKIVQERLGHTDVKVTMEIYSHVTPTIQRQAVEALENLPI